MEMTIDYDYSTRENEWSVKVDGDVVFTISDEHVMAIAHDYGIMIPLVAFKMCVADAIMKGLSLSENECLVKWFLTKIMKYGI